MKQFLQRKNQHRFNRPIVQNEDRPKESFIVKGVVFDETASKLLEEENTTPEGYEELPVYNLSEYTIDHIDRILQSRLLSRIKNIHYLYHQLNDSHEKDQLRILIRDIEIGFEYIYYLVTTQHIIKEYLELTKLTSTSSFIQTAESQKLLREHHHRRQELVMLYVTLTKPFITIEYKIPSSSLLRCDQCQHTKLTCVNSIENIYVCQSCYAENYVQSNQKPIFKDIDRINFNTKHPYSRLNHIREAVNCFQGLEPVPQRINEVIDIIKRHCEYYKISFDPNDPNFLTRRDVYMFLEQERSSKESLSEFYKNVNLIHRMITGVPCPDLSDYLDQLYTDFVIQEQMYDSMDHGSRSNSLNVYYKLYKLLQRQGAPYTSKDFFLLKTKEVLDAHDEETKKVWKQLGWEWIDTV